MCNQQVVLPTAVVLLKRPNGKYIECRALLDSGSQANFITQNIVAKLDCDITSLNSIQINGISTTSASISERISTELKSKVRDFSCKLDFLVIDKISNNLPQNGFDITRWMIPQNVKLADPLFNVPRPIDILLGAAIFPSVLLNQQITLQPELPVLQDSQFGWIFFGALSTDVVQNLTLQATFVQHDDDLSKQVAKFWELENLPTKNYLSPEEVHLEKHFVNTHYRTSDGRYNVFLPLKENLTVCESKQRASKRFSYILSGNLSKILNLNNNTFLLWMNTSP